MEDEMRKGHKRRYYRRVRHARLRNQRRMK